MDARSLRGLEFDRVLAFLTTLAETPLGRARIAAVAPMRLGEDVRRELDRVDEWRSRIERGSDFAIGELADVAPILSALTKEGLVLSGEDAAAIAHMVQRFADVDRFLSSFPEGSALRDLHIDCPGLTVLARELARIFDVRGHVLDTASADLRSIRAERRASAGRLERALDRFFEQHPELTERIVTVRDDRSVVAVRSDLNPASYGFVHGRSQSGATFYVEPFVILPLNNEVIELRDREEHEIERILRAVTRRLAELLPELGAAASRIAEVDFVRARARLQRMLGGGRVEIAADGGIELEEARHPLLVLRASDPRIGRRDTVPLSLRMAAAEVLVITGPNTGGKTVALKTVGLSLAMFAHGLPVPAVAARLPVLGALVVDIGDPQDLGNDLSTFAGHMKVIGGALEGLSPPAVVLLDELGAGTDPREGGALGVAIVESFRRAGVTVIATSHHEALKRYALTADGARAAAVDFDSETLRPTFHLSLDRAGSSNALIIAGRLGVPAPVIEAARSRLSSEASELDRAVLSLERRSEEHDRQRAAAEAELALSIAEREVLTRRADELRARERELEERERGVRRRLRDEVEARLRDGLEELRVEALSRLDALGADAASKRVERALVRVAASLSARALEISGTGAPVVRDAEAEEPAARVGDEVRVEPFGVSGELVALSADEAQVVVAGKKLIVSPTALRRLRGPSVVAVRVEAHAESRSGAPAELNLIGSNVEDGIERLDRFLDDAVLARLPSVRVIHGHGSGRLRAGVRGHLAHHPHVRETESESGGGATRAVLDL